MLNERKLTENEIEQRKIALKGLLKNKRSLVKKYGSDAEKVMYGIATKQAKKKVEDMNKENIKELIKSALSKSTSVKEYMGKKGDEVMISKTGKDNPVYVLEKPDGSAQINMTFSSEDEAKKYASKKSLKLSSTKGYNMDERISEIDAMLDERITFDDVLDLRADKKDLENRISQLYRDMEQEAEPEGGEVADRYGAELEKLETKLYRVSKQISDYDMNESTRQDLGMSSSVTKRRAKAELNNPGNDGSKVYGLDKDGKRVHIKSINDIDKFKKFELDADIYESTVTESKGAKNYFDDVKYVYQKAFRYLEANEKEEYKQLAKNFFSKLQEGTPLQEETFEDEIERLKDIMYVDGENPNQIMIHPLSKPNERRPSRDYIIVKGNNVVAVQGHDSGPIQDLADSYGLNIDTRSSLTPMGKVNASGQASLLSSNILRDAIKAIKDSRDLEAKRQSDYYKSRGPVSGVGNMDEMIKSIVKEKLTKRKVNEGFKVGDKVTYLGHPAEITLVDKDVMDRVYYNVSYDKGTGKTKASNIYNKGEEIKAVK